MNRTLEDKKRMLKALQHEVAEEEKRAAEEKKAAQAQAAKQQAWDAERARLAATSRRAAEEERRQTATAVLSIPRIKLTDKEILLNLEEARKNLELFGTVEPPVEALWATQEMKCPHCKEWKNVAREFGFRRRTSDGRQVPQAWCKACKNSPASHPSRNGLPLKTLQGRKRLPRQMRPAQPKKK